MVEIARGFVNSVALNNLHKPGGANPEAGFLNIIPSGIPTYAGMKTGFHADVSPKNRFSCRRRSEGRRK